MNSYQIPKTANIIVQLNQHKSRPAPPPPDVFTILAPPTQYTLLRMRMDAGPSTIIHRDGSGTRLYPTLYAMPWVEAVYMASCSNSSNRTWTWVCLIFQRGSWIDQFLILHAVQVSTIWNTPKALWRSSCSSWYHDTKSQHTEIKSWRCCWSNIKNPDLRETELTHQYKMHPLVSDWYTKPCAIHILIDGVTLVRVTALVLSLQHWNRALPSRGQPLR